MTLKLILAVTLIAVAPAIAFAQRDDPVDHAPKSTVEGAQKLVQTISSDKAKLQAYCEIGDLQQQMDKAEEKNDRRHLMLSSQKSQPRAANRARLRKDRGWARGSRPEFCRGKEVYGHIRPPPQAVQITSRARGEKKSRSSLSRSGLGIR